MKNGGVKAKDIDTKNYYIEEENRILRETIIQLRSELEKYRQPPLLIAEVSELKDDKVIIRLNNGNSFLVNIVDGLTVKPGDTVFVEQKNLVIVDKSEGLNKFDVEKFVIMEKPNVKWKDIGGLKEAIEETREVVELPLKKPDLFRKIGISPPRGVLFYGPPGTGKTLLAKAVATSTKATFIEIVASELVQKFIGEGAKLVKEIFALARRKAPSIIFIDEVDALAAKRIELGTSGEREVQRTFMQLLAEIDGFKPLGNVKIIAATNRPDILDPALIRPGRLDRLIEIGLPDEKGRKEIFRIHTRDMPIGKDVKFSFLVKETKGFSGADIKALCTEAGYRAIRRNSSKVEMRDFIDALKKLKKSEDKSYRYMFG